MRRTAKFLILLLLVGALLVLHITPPPARAQAPPQPCDKTISHYTYYPCPNCCSDSSDSSENEYAGISDSSPGCMSVGDITVKCGSAQPPNCTADQCGTQTYPDNVVADDAGCVATNNGKACTTDAPCCRCDLTTRNCTSFCVPNGDTAVSESDCCSGSWDPNTHECLCQ